MYRFIYLIENAVCGTGKASRKQFHGFHTSSVFQTSRVEDLELKKLTRGLYGGFSTPADLKSNQPKKLMRCRSMGFFTTSVVEAGKTKEYEGRKLIGFSMEQIYNVVADIGQYKNFVPFCKKSDIISKSEDYLRANLVIGFPPLHESYTSKVTMHQPYFVKAECTDGKLFNHLNTLWIFSPGLKNNPDTCVIDFSLSFEFKSIIHSHLSNLFFNEIVRQMENAFIDEAYNRYGRPCIQTVRLQR